MRKVGPVMWVRDDDHFAYKYFDPSGIRYQPPGDRFEIEHLDKALEFVKGFRTAIDAGAYYGSWARYMAKRFERVWAFEPVVETWACLYQNTRHLSNVNVLRTALGSFSGIATVGVGQMYHHPGMETVVDARRALSDEMPDGPGEVRVIKVDALCLTDLDFLKLDVEGFEYEILLGAEKTLQRCHPVVLFEENLRGKLEHNVDPGDCGRVLTDLGAELVARIGSDHIYVWR